MIFFKKELSCTSGRDLNSEMVSHLENYINRPEHKPEGLGVQPSGEHLATCARPWVPSQHCKE
jgi:hypothetical protein